MDGSEKGTRCRSGEARRQEHGAGVPGEADDVVSRQQDADVADLPVEEEERGEDGDKRPLAHAAQLAHQQMWLEALSQSSHRTDGAERFVTRHKVL